MRVHEFCCTTCGFETTSSGGRASGMMAIMQTIVCHDCHRLYDIQTGFWDEPLSLEEIQRKLICRQDVRHRTSIWNHPGPRPVCGTVLERGRMTALWD